MFRRRSLAARMRFLIAGLVLLALVTSLVVWQSTLAIIEASVEQTESILTQGEFTKVKLASDAAASIIGIAIKDVDETEKRKEMIRNLVDQFRFEEDSSGYFFVYDNTTVLALPPNKSLIGKELANFADPNGVKFLAKL